MDDVVAEVITNREPTNASLTRSERPKILRKSQS
jgi:hypothetical protein